jgi:Double-GTPase 2
MANGNGGRGFWRKVARIANDAGTAFAEVQAQQSGRASGGHWTRCPYCTEWIDLARCHVISAVRGGRHTPGRSSFDDLGPSGSDPDDPEGIGEARPPARLLYDPNAQQPRSGTGALLDGLHAGAPRGTQLVPLDKIAPLKLMPRRRCARCGHQLPVEVDRLPVKFLAVVGVTSAGKTIYLAQSLREATRRGSLGRFGCTEFALTDTDDTADVLFNKYFERLFRRQDLLPATDPTEGPTQFTFTATVSGDEFLVVTHDIAGETISDPYARAQELIFLPRADAVIFLLDPVDFDAVRVRLPAHVIGPGKPADQVHVLRQCIAELDEAGRSEVPVRIAVAKADLLSTYCGIDGPWRQPSSGDWRQDVWDIDEAVRKMLSAIGETEVLRVVERRERVLFHAISSLGAAPGEDRRLPQGEPFRCSDPLGSALYSIARPPLVTT